MALAAAIISGLGMIAEGVGTGIAGTTQGTAQCGSQPACLFTKECKKRREEWQECANRQQDILEQSLTYSEIQDKRLQEAKTKRNKIIAISLSVVAVTGLIIFIVYKTKNR